MLCPKQTNLKITNKTNTINNNLFSSLLAVFLILILNGFPFPIYGLNIESIKDTSVVPGPEYQAGALYKLFLGEHWRDLWITPITVPIIDLQKTAGGLVPIKRGGGFQTKSLHFKGSNGKYYKFRSINKDPSKLLPKYLQKTFVADIYKDQISASHPISSLIVAPLLNAVGVLNANPVVVVLPNSNLLGEYHEDFANVLGTFAENPKDETREAILFEGADKVIKNYEIFEKCEKSNKNQVDALEFLKARLMDIFLGDWDRHIGQWKWARFRTNGTNLWKPIPRDRDQAFSRWDGVFPQMVARAIPQIEHFESEYPQVNDISWSGRYLDRRFLAPVTETKWDSITNFLVARLDDKTIKNAVRQIPPEWFEKNGAELIEILISRRNDLKKISRKYYEMIFKYISIYASNKDEIAQINRINDDQVELILIDKNKNFPFFQKIFDNDITKEIRLFMLGGDDKAIITGDVEVSPLIRVIGGKGRDTLIDSSVVNGYFLYITPFSYAEHKTTFYDSGKKTTFVTGPSTRINIDKEKKLKLFNEDIDNINEKYEPQTEDRGHDWKPGAWLSYNSDDGIIIGGGPSLYEFDYRYEPFVYRLSLQAAYATIPKSWNLRFNSEFYHVIKNTRITLDVGKSELSFTQFYGLGNDTKKDDNLEDSNFYRVNQELLFIDSIFEYPASKNYKVWLGYTYRFSQIYIKSGSFLDLERPNGVEDWSYMGIGSGFEFDNRDNEVSPHSGFYLNFCNMHFPPWLDNEKSYSKTRLDLRTYIKSNFLTNSSIAIRFYGTKLWGSYPFFDAAFLGGSENLRGYNRERFAGSAALYGSAEWRVHLFPFEFVVPAQFGALIFTDVGRVYYPGDNSNKLHKSYGAGIWAYFIEPSYLGNFTVARSSEELAFYLSVGFAY